MNHQKCQIRYWPHASTGTIDPGPQPLKQQFKLWLKRILAPRTKRIVKHHIARMYAYIPTEKTPPPETELLNLQAGEVVRVRSYKEIARMLDLWGEQRRCNFMEGMREFCGTTQRVFKPVRQFLDERDYRLKKTKGIVLLENVICQGIPEYGPCDRSCFYFWREEWLERQK